MGEVGAGVRFLIHKLVVPSLRSGHARLTELSGSDKWRYYDVPLAKEPVADLLRAIARQEGRDAQWVTRQADEFRDDKTTLSRILGADAERSAVLVFHRFGSLLAASRGECKAITDNLAHLLQDPQQRYYAITALRRDHTIALSKFGALEKRLRDGHVLMAFTTAELRHLIEEPARRVGLIFEPGLVDQILIDIQGEATALPLLRFTLVRLWNHRQRNRITWEAYEQTGAGRAALGKVMDEVYGALTEDQQRTLREILLAMVNLEPDGSFSTGEVSREDLYRICGNRAQVDEVLDKLQRQELIREVPGEDQVTFAVAYNALLISWPPLISWLDELRVRERFRLRLRQAATLWNERRKPNDLLWQGAMLVEANEEFEQDSSLTTSEQHFLHASRRRKTRKQRKRYAAITFVVFAVLAVVLGIPIAQQRAERQQRMYGKAADSLAKGDTAATLLWLSARDGTSGLMPRSSKGAGQKMGELVRLQLPRLQTLATVEDEKHDAFQDIALSSDGQYLAAICREIVVQPDQNQTEQNKTTVQVYSLANPSEESRPVASFPVENNGSRNAGVAFVDLEVGVSKTQYLLVGADRLYAWKRNGEIWTETNVQPLPSADAPIVALAVGGGSLMLSIQQEQKRRRLRLWNVASERGTDGLTLTEAQDGLDELGDKNVQLACLSSKGHLLAACGKELNQTTELLVWFKTEDSWELAAPPDWVTRLADGDPQRLYDWGWTLTGDESSKDRHWKRIGSWIRTASFSPSGDQFMTGCDDGQVLLWNLPKREREGDGQAAFIAISTLQALEKALVAANYWFNQQAPQIGPLVTPQFETRRTLGSSVFDIAFVTDDVVITGGRDRTARIWDIHAGAEIASQTSHEGTVDHVRFGPSGMLITNTSRTLRIWRSEDYATIESATKVQQIARSEENDRIVYVPIPNTTPEKSLPASLDAQDVTDQNIRSIITSPDGSWTFTASQTNQKDAIVMKLRAWSAFDQPIGLKIPATKLNEVPIASFSASGDWLAVARKRGGDSSPGLFFWNLESRNVEATNSSEYSLDLPRASYEFTNLAFTRLGNVEVLILVGRKDLDSDLPPGVIFVALREPKEFAWRLCRLEVDDPKDPAPHEEEVLCLGFSADGKLLATGDAHDQVKLWSVEELVKQTRQSTDDVVLAEPTDVLDHSSNVETLAFAPNASKAEARLVTVSSEGEASVWSITDGSGNDTPDYRLRHDAKILTVSFSPDGKWIITGGADRTARVWDSTDGQPVGIFRHQGAVVQAWMPQDDEILTVSKSSRVGLAGQDPPLHVRHWSVSDAAKEPASEENLERIAARRVVGMELEVLKASDFASEP